MRVEQVQLGHPSRIFLRPRVSRCAGATLEWKVSNWGGGLGLTCLVPSVTRALVAGRGFAVVVELAGVRAGGPRAGPEGAGAGVGRNGFAACGGGRAGAFRRNAGRSHASVTQSLLTSDTSRLKDVRGGASPWASAVANCAGVAASAQNSCVDDRRGAHGHKFWAAGNPASKGG
jgi:hypothetical protein